MSNTKDVPVNAGDGTSCCGPSCCSPVASVGDAVIVHDQKQAEAMPANTVSDIKDVVKEKYGKAALRVTATQGTSCCGPSCCSSVPGAVDPITVNLYDRKQTEGLPAEAVLASLGCGNPTALARLNPGEVVLDLGSGGGIDVLLSAKRVGPTGKAYGLDMTDEMLTPAPRGYPPGRGPRREGRHRTRRPTDGQNVGARPSGVRHALSFIPQTVHSGGASGDPDTSTG